MAHMDPSGMDNVLNLTGICLKCKAQKMAFDSKTPLRVVGLGLRDRV